VCHAILFAFPEFLEILHNYRNNRQTNKERKVKNRKKKEEK